jgi:hypothetical protein
VCVCLTFSIYFRAETTTDDDDTTTQTEPDFEGDTKRTVTDEFIIDEFNAKDTDENTESASQQDDNERRNDKQPHVDDEL